MLNNMKFTKKSVETDYLFVSEEVDIRLAFAFLRFCVAITLCFATFALIAFRFG